MLGFVEVFKGYSSMGDRDLSEWGMQCNAHVRALSQTGVMHPASAVIALHTMHGLALPATTMPLHQKKIEYPIHNQTPTSKNNLSCNC